MAGSELQKRPANTVDRHDEPSVGWGWHGGFPRGTRIMGWFVAAVMFLFLIGNHQGRTEDVWLIGVGAAMVLALVIDMVRRRTSWRR